MKYVYVVWVQYGNQYVSKEEIGGIFSTEEKAIKFRLEVFEHRQLYARIAEFLVDANA